MYAIWAKIEASAQQFFNAGSNHMKIPMNENVLPCGIVQRTFVAIV